MHINILMHVRHNRNFHTTAAAKVNSCCLFNKTFSLPGLQLYIPLMMTFFFCQPDSNKNAYCFEVYKDIITKIYC